MDSSKFNSLRYTKPLEEEVDPLTKIRVEKFIELIEPCGTLLDIGCWDGYIMREILKQKKAKNVKGVDNSKPAIALGRKNGFDISFASADKRLPFKNNRFDCVSATEIIEHLYDVNMFLKEVYRVLKPNGQFILTTPNIASLGARLSLLMGVAPWMIETELTSQTSGHIRYYTFSSLHKLLSKYKFFLAESSTDILSVTPKFYIKWNNNFPSFLKSFGRIIIVKYKKIT